MTAVQYQIAIMTAIFSGTTLTVALAIPLSVKTAFTPLATPDPDIFRNRAQGT